MHTEQILEHVSFTQTMGLNPFNLKTKIVDAAFSEYMLTNYDKRSSSTRQMLSEWLKIGNRCFCDCIEFSALNYKANAISNYMRDVLSRKNAKAAERKVVSEFKISLNAINSGFYDNKWKLHDLLVGSKSIGEWYRHLNTRLLSPQQHCKSLLLKGKQIAQLKLGNQSKHSDPGSKV